MHLNKVNNYQIDKCIFMDSIFFNNNFLIEIKTIQRQTILFNNKLISRYYQNDNILSY